ncbi:Nuclear exosomal RNA helicase MTR4, DEAD-box superfamily, partial [Pseudoloma neurophilia]
TPHQKKKSHVDKLKDRSLKAFEKLDNKSDTFNINNFNDAISNIRRNRLDQSDISNIIDLLESKNLLPLIVFSFRRKDCEKYATSLDKNYTTDEEKEKIKIIFENAIKTLDKNDQNLMPIKSLLPLLQRGIGIHHSGLLSILKETQEILFSLNLIKILFATETFSIGLNMPAKSIIFSTVFKFDGTETRPITSGEYIQMSGRAGRRGLDKEGICISILTESINIETALTLYNGKCNPIRSAFHLTYNMILNIISKEKDPIYLLKRSFYHFQKMRSIQSLA